MEKISSRSQMVKYEPQGRYDTIFMCLAALLDQQFEPPITAHVDAHPFYRLWPHQF